ncbi:tRNA (guanosine(46)-N7)-methyltransferase TrmB [Guyparkeria hydrothermalis]|uniref:tRNA (guanosine(46)-N7)-methyltransferase TrmB n=1 Tax=Guyparkeria hydrothermalis TaxID=923 RepID=UPI0020213F4B|nr:tRNA (guanosine(46)-N7)-methyltransferase TrmB [Guyparkeria hydrothermalis]MCL7745230.1 tRNA (guanosine(46)-N7)-methyltransferase TrmB [Guyparkeria hydrothermalis]
MSETSQKSDGIRRRIRSFIRREGRLTPGQQRALNELGPKYLIEPTGPQLDPSELFGRQAPLTLEIGFGNGDSLVEMAAKDPDGDYIGIEVHRPGVGHLLNGIEHFGLTNLMAVCGDAMPFVEERLGEGSLDRLLLYFPDPWHKKRHHKRRIVQTPFADLVASRIKPGGLWHLATDWAEYAEHMREVLNAHPAFAAEHAGTGENARPDWRPRTKFERRGEERGHQVFDLLYRRR